VYNLNVRRTNVTDTIALSKSKHYKYINIIK
jgi:hypothetical protein